MFKHTPTPKFSSDSTTYTRFLISLYKPNFNKINSSRTIVNKIRNCKIEYSIAFECIKEIKSIKANTKND